MIDNIIIFFKSDLYIYEKLIIAFMFGAIFGSFINVIIYRAHKKESILKSSKCPKCNKNILFIFNIPVIGFLLTKGKCFYCKKKIDISYIKIEIIFGLVSLICFLLFNFSYLFLISFFLFCYIYSHLKIRL